MTRLLVRVVTADEASIAARGGCDVVEVAMAAVDIAVIRDIRAAFPRRLRLRIDGAPAGQPRVPGPLGLDAGLEAAAAVGADEVALPADRIDAILAGIGDGPPLPASITLVASVLADHRDAFGAVSALAGRVGGVVLDVEAGARLVDVVAIARLDAFVQSCRRLGLACGLAGGLEAPDVARLLLLQPDLLGFDLALRRDHRADRSLDEKAVATIRALIPRERPTVDKHEHELGATALALTAETDHIFVHDFVALLSIGAYQAERGVRQRVRFSVDADVRRPAEPPIDMRGVFSYDIIIETIRVLASRAHVTFVETLAEEIAATLLAYPQLTVVTVKVEKLDVIEGAVGIVIRRDRETITDSSGEL